MNLYTIKLAGKVLLAIVCFLAICWLLQGGR
jgi:hypothetical protein